MGPAGQLFVQDEVSDLEVVEAHRATFAKEPPGGAGGFMGERRRLWGPRRNALLAAMGAAAKAARCANASNRF